MAGTADLVPRNSIARHRHHVERSPPSFTVSIGRWHAIALALSFSSLRTWAALRPFFFDNAEELAAPTAAQEVKNGLSNPSKERDEWP